MDITLLQKNYILVPISILLSIVLMYAINIALKDEEKQKSYVKTSAVVGIITLLIVYIHQLVPAIEEVILSPPPF